MVREANVKRAAAEKQLKEAQGKVCGAFLALCEFLHPGLIFSRLRPCLPDRRPSSRSDGAQDSGVDLDALLAQPPAPPSAAVSEHQGRLQAPQPQQEHEQHHCIPSWKSRTFLRLHPAGVQRGARGKLTSGGAYARSCVLPPFSRFSPACANLPLTCSSSQSLVCLPPSACCSCSPLSDTLPGPPAFLGDHSR